MNGWQDWILGIARGLETGIRLALAGWQRWRSPRTSTEVFDAVESGMLWQHAACRARALFDHHLHFERLRIRRQCLQQSSRQLIDLDRLTERAGRHHRPRPPV